jgi:hypothetical protein
VGIQLAREPGSRELDGKDAQAHLAAAREIFGSLDLAWDLARLESMSLP